MTRMHRRKVVLAEKDQKNGQPRRDCDWESKKMHAVDDTAAVSALFCGDTAALSWLNGTPTKATSNRFHSNVNNYLGIFKSKHLLKALTTDTKYIQTWMYSYKLFNNKTTEIANWDSSSTEEQVPKYIKILIKIYLF